MAVCENSLFGEGSKYLKFQAGDLIAVDGQNTVDRLVLNDLNLPYKQLTKFKITLEKGQEDYLLDQFDDKTTFFAIVARYNAKSKVEDKNYLRWNWIDNSRSQYFSKLLMMHTNSANPFTGIYLHNPNLDFGVNIDILIAT